MLSPKIFSFLDELGRNNSKAWFDDHRDEWKGCRTDVLDLVQELIDEVARFDPNIAAAHLDPSRCMTKINRDPRFVRDGRPYKDYVLVVLNGLDFHGSRSAGYYLQIQARDSFLGGGIFQTEPRALATIRAAVDEDFDRFTAIVTSTTFVDRYPNGVRAADSLKRPPRGYSEDNPAIDHLKLKGLCSKELIPTEQLTGPDCVSTVVDHFRAAKPLVDFVNAAVAGP